MKKIYFPLILTCFALADVSTVSYAGPGEKVDLKLRLQQGKTYKTRMVYDQKMTQTLQGREMEINQKMAMDFAFDVQEVGEAGDATIKVTFQGISAEMEGPMGKISYDSASPTEVDHPMMKGFAAIAGQSYIMVLSEKGEVKKVDGVKEMMSRIIDSLELPDGQMREMMKKQFEDMFGDQATAEMMGQWFSMIPDRPVEAGDSWTKTISITAGMPMTIDYKWTLKERKGGIAVLAVESVLKSNPDAGPMEMGPMKITMDVSGEQSGTYELDESTGWIVRSRMTQKISGEQIIEGGPAEEGGMSIPLAMETIITLEPL
jgi:hypothetical protein